MVYSPQREKQFEHGHVTHDQELAVPVLHQPQCNTIPLNGALQRVPLGMMFSPCPTGS